MSKKEGERERDRSHAREKTGEREITRSKERTESRGCCFAPVFRAPCVCVCKCVNLCVCAKERVRERQRERERKTEREREKESVCVCMRAQKRASDHSVYSVRASMHERDIARVKENIKSLCV